jgi:hypothetical protein
MYIESRVIKVIKVKSSINITKKRKGDKTKNKPTFVMENSRPNAKRINITPN